MSIFDIPSDRLVDLSDADLRELIARLCEAERERQGGHRNEVRWGGSQTAADGGLDVVIEPVGPFVAAGPLTRRDVGIQVKAADYAPAAITLEMRYGGSLRPAISTLAARNGAYLIASAGANCSESMYQRRIAAMRNAVADDPNNESLDLGFLDRNSIGRWVSAHPSVAAWLRSRLALPMLAGWQPHGRWSSTPEGEADDFICENGLVFNIIEHQGPQRNLPNALDEIRRLVREGTGAVRIAGLSGIGKSRIVQALFEPVGDVASLPASHAVYSDLGHSPDPAPFAMLEALLELDAPAILVVDNCPPDTHQTLARRLAERAGPVRLITIEYDVRTDQPEETDVIQIEAEGPEIVEALLCSRRRDLSSGDARRLAEIAQGNARLGLALASAAPRTGSLSAFQEAEFFDRLFWQRGERIDELARAAEALSLVYSFEVDGEEEPDELAFLGSLVELSRGAMHRHTATLLDRGLAQARSRWRAVLPHALANRLAQQALRSIPWRTIADGFSDKPRLRRSLSRRLSYLHNADEARCIVVRWMEEGGPLHGPTPDLQLLEAVCHLAPREALQSVNNSVAALIGAFPEIKVLDHLVQIVIRIAYSEAMFLEACESLLNLSDEFEKRNVSETSYADDALNDLFGLLGSGTFAQTELRIQVARQLFLMCDMNRNKQGIRMLRSALRTSHWSPPIMTYDDARPAAFGWEPNAQETVEWFTAWLELAVEIALSGPNSIRGEARKAIADGVDGLWRRVPNLRRRIDEVARQLHEAAPWVEGLHSLRQMLYFIRRRGEEFPRTDIENVLELIEHLEPTDLEARVRAEIAKGWDFDFENEDEDEDVSAAESRRARRLEEMGQELAANPEVLRVVGRDFLEAEGGSFFPLGTGLAQGAAAPIEVWGVLRDIHLAAPTKTRQSSVLSGFIQQLDTSDAVATNEIRTECRATPALRQEYAIFLPRGVLSQEEFENVIEITGEPETATWQLIDISWREERELNDVSRIRLLRTVLSKPGGPGLVVDALGRLRYVERNARDRWPEDLREIGFDAITAIISAEELNPTKDDRISHALTACLRGDDGRGASRVVEAILARAARRYGSTHDVERTLVALAEQSPGVFLDHVFSNDAEGPAIRFADGRRPGPLSHVPPQALIAWCRQNSDRWARVAPWISPFSRGIDDEGESGQISPLALAFLEAAPNPVTVIEAYFQNLAPMSWSGSRAAIMERRLSIMEALQDHPTIDVRQVIAHLTPDLRHRIARIRRAELDESRQRDERFE